MKKFERRMSEKVLDPLTDLSTWSDDALDDARTDLVQNIEDIRLQLEDTAGIPDDDLSDEDAEWEIRARDAKRHITKALVLVKKEQSKRFKVKKLAALEKGKLLGVTETPKKAIGVTLIRYLMNRLDEKGFEFPDDILDKYEEFTGKEFTTFASRQARRELQAQEVDVR